VGVRKGGRGGEQVLGRGNVSTNHTPSLKQRKKETGNGQEEGRNFTQ